MISIWKVKMEKNDLIKSKAKNRLHCYNLKYMNEIKTSLK